MSQAEGYAAKIISEAEALIGKVQGDLDRAAEFYQSNGIDPEKVAPAMEQFMGAKERAELEQLAKADREAIDQEVAEGAARANFADASSGGGVKRPRNLV
jgi:hypothetical protein